MFMYEAVAASDLYLMINEACQSSGVHWTSDGLMMDMAALPHNTTQEMHPDINIGDFTFT